MRADVEDENVHCLRTILLHPSTVLTEKYGVLKYRILAPVLKINIGEKGYRLNEDATSSLHCHALGKRSVVEKEMVKARGSSVSKHGWNRNQGRSRQINKVYKWTENIPWLINI